MNKPVETNNALSYHLDDCQARHIEYPDSFEVPSQTELSNIQIGDYIKLIFIPNMNDKRNESPGGERMWVRVVQINGDTFLGVLDNEPVVVLSLQLGDIIEFKATHVASIFEIPKDRKVENQLSS